MEPEELKVRQRLKDDFNHYASKCLFIRTKNANVEPLLLNKAQLYIQQQLDAQLKETGIVRALVLKGRQQGVSTLIEGRFFHKVTHRRNVRAYILTHQEKATQELFKMAQRYYDKCPLIVRPQASSKSTNSLDFGRLDSGYAVGTAGSKDVGRGSTIQYFHGSEVAMWPNAEEHSTGILQAIPNAPGTEIILESTAKGLGNFFHQQWQMAVTGKSNYQAIFVPWYWQDEYKTKLKEPLRLDDYEMEIKELYNLSDEQLFWRRGKVNEFSGNGMDGAQLFKQEYPLNAAEAFQTSGFESFISPELVMQARKTVCEGVGPLLLGVDPARYGDDRTSLIVRQGRKSYRLQSFEKKDTMEATGIVHLWILELKPAKVFVDVIGIGSGVVDRLIELGHGDIVVGVNSACKPINAVLYHNKRAEMWGETKRWLSDTPVQIPDSDSLHADLCAPTHTSDSNGRLVIEKKENIKKRGLRSPDEADALCLTFAQPVSNTNYIIDTLISESTYYQGILA